MVLESVCIDSVPPYPIHKLADVHTTFFLDIETTGFSAKTSSLYLIGCLFYKNNVWNLVQWFAENNEEEKEILMSFKEFLKDYKTVIHFNGNGFDLPYLAHKFTRFKLINPLEDLENIDLYKSIRPYKAVLKLENLKQKTIESFLAIRRDDVFSGGDLISLYKEYCTMPSEMLRKVLLLHNHDDMLGMLALLPVLYYDDLFRGDFSLTSIDVFEAKDMDGNVRLEGIMELELSDNIPVPISYGTESLYFKANGKTAFLKFPCVQKELKFFFDNYKDYYYLPDEDMAIHKSVASYVNKDYRIQAKAATCYTRKLGLFCPQNETLFSPYFKREYSDSYTYFELTDDFVHSEENKFKYCRHLLYCLLQGILLN